MYIRTHNADDLFLNVVGPLWSHKLSLSSFCYPLLRFAYRVLRSYLQHFVLYDRFIYSLSSFQETHFIFPSTGQCRQNKFFFSYFSGQACICSRVDGVHHGLSVQRNFPLVKHRIVKRISTLTSIACFGIPECYLIEIAPCFCWCRHVFQMIYSQ